MRSRFIASLTSASLVIGTLPAPLSAQVPPSQPPREAAAPATVDKFNTEQLDAMLAPIALYPDALLTQVLMATTNPLEIVAARRWLDQGSNKDLKGTALENALKAQSWDPAVKSLIPFPQVLDMLNQNLDWMQQLGYAMQVQQAEVFDSVQRLRKQAQIAGNLQSNAQQIVRTEPPAEPPPGVSVAPGGPTQVIVIEPAQPDVVYVPAYNPSVVYGTWPYATPPVYYPPAPYYGYGSALLTGVAFAAGIAITAGLWNLARPNWGCCWGGSGWYGGYNNVHVNVNRWNNINVNRPWPGGPNGQWRPNNPNYRPGGNWNRPGGPVGRPAQPTPLPANAIGRGGVSAPGNVVRPPAGMGPGNHPSIGPGGSRPPGQGQGVGPGTRPGAGTPGGRPGTGPVQGRPGGGGGAQTLAAPTQRPAAAPNYSRPGTSFSGMNDGRSAQAYGQRGAQSRQMGAPTRGGGQFGGGHGGAGGRAGGGGRRR